MRAKTCTDGINRIQAKIIVPMGVQEITKFAMANPMFHRDEEAMNAFENLNKRQMFNIAKESVALRGDSLEIADHYVQEFWTTRQIRRAVAHVTTLFPEVS
jgi:hypothetical protein